MRIQNIHFWEIKPRCEPRAPIGGLKTRRQNRPGRRLTSRHITPRSRSRRPRIAERIVNIFRVNPGVIHTQYNVHEEVPFAQSWLSGLECTARCATSGGAYTCAAACREGPIEQARLSSLQVCAKYPRRHIPRRYFRDAEIRGERGTSESAASRAPCTPYVNARGSRVLAYTSACWRPTFRVSGRLAKPRENIASTN